MVDIFKGFVMPWVIFPFFHDFDRFRLYYKNYGLFIMPPLPADREGIMLEVVTGKAK